LPGGVGNGDLGPDAYRFVNWLAEAGFSVWQTLPLGPTLEPLGSPYTCLSAHAGNPLLVALEPLEEAGWLQAAEGPGAGEVPAEYRKRRLREARQGFEQWANEAEWQDYRAFQSSHEHWLEDFARFMAIRHLQGDRPWWLWPAPMRDRKPEAMAELAGEHAEELEQVRFEQYLFFRQWGRLREHAKDRGVQLFGDMPIFVAHDSAEVWAHRDLFALDETGDLETAAGVPPDYFSATGQYWGNPHYRWDRIAADGYRWWIERMQTQLELFDWVRIDHFRGFAAYWEIPAEAETAMDGRWVSGPGRAFFDALREELGSLPLVAEDLGVITEEVTGLRDALGLPGMKILQFAFDSDGDNPYLPHNHEPRFVVYTGTHDNNTTLGWWREEADGALRERVLDYLGQPEEAMPWPLVRSALASVAMVAVVPLQDLLGLGAEHRMNQPGTMDGNWQWRFGWQQLPDDLGEALSHLNRLYARSD
jgi:4-alpha-glucanotransferase